MGGTYCICKVLLVSNQRYIQSCICAARWLSKTFSCRHHLLCIQRSVAQIAACSVGVGAGLGAMGWRIPFFWWFWAWAGRRPAEFFVIAAGEASLKWLLS